MNFIPAVIRYNEARTKVLIEVANLTNEARKYVVTTDVTHLTDYWTAINVTQTDQKIISRLRELGAPQSELDLIQQSKDSSDVAAIWGLMSTKRPELRFRLGI